MVTYPKNTAQKRNPLLDEKWELVSEKRELDAERTGKWKKDKAPNLLLDQKRRELFHRLQQIERQISRSPSRSLLERRWLQFFIA